MSHKIFEAFTQLNSMEELSNRKEWPNGVHCLAKLMVTLVYLAILMSFHKYNIIGTVGMILYPSVLFVAGDLPIRKSIYRLRFLIAFIILMGTANLFFDRTVITVTENISITGGMLSLITLGMKGIFALSASIILMATTKIDEICRALRMLHVPRPIVTQIMLTYRYLSVIMEELGRMTQAYALRAPGQKGIGFHAWGSFAGQLLLRSVDRAELIFESMQLRGFCGEFPLTDSPKFGWGDFSYLAIWTILLIGIRYLNLLELVGSLLIGV